MKKNDLYKIVRLYGGLGNQMFQYAFGLSLEKHLKATVLFDRDWFSLPDAKRINNDGVIPRPYALDVFPNLNIKFATKRHKREAMENYWSFCSIIKRRIRDKFHLNWRLPRASDFVITNPEYGKFEPSFFKATSTEGTKIKIYDGYWQNEKYFAEIEQDIRNAFCFPEFNDDFNKDISQKILKCPCSVSLHVRRGDYISFGWELSLEYYVRAMHFICKQFPDAAFFVFGQNSDHFQDTFGLKSNVYFIDGYNTKNHQDFRDMQLMSLCRHSIIANSSFSWWAAWLGKKDRQVVIAPSPWIHNQDDIVCERWHKIVNRT